MAAATADASVTSGGTKMTSSESTFGSSSTSGIAPRYPSAVALAIMSTGFLTLASAGRNARNAAFVASVSGGTSRPFASHASVAMIPGPPAFVMIATRLPFGTGWFASSIDMSKSSSIVSVRITPVCRKTASTAVSAPARAPVCDDAARAPAALRPLFTATIGFFRATRRAICANRRGFPKLSRYRRITSVSGSFSQCSMRSLPETSALFPTETKLRTPIPSAAA